MEKVWKEKDEDLISVVKRYHIIFDPTHKHYKNNFLKHKTWKEISKIVGVPAIECKKRWKTLRDVYRRRKRQESKGIRSSGSGPAHNAEYMRLLSFLSDNTERQGNSSEEKRDTEPVLRGHEIMFKQEAMEEPSSPENEDPFDENPEVTASTSRHVDSKSRSFVEPFVSDGKFRELVEVLERIEANQRMAMYEKMSMKPPEKSAIRKFFDSLADIVEKFPITAQAEIRLKVCDMVTEQELKLAQK